MRKRFMPFLVVFFSAMLDTAVLPCLMDAPWMVSVTLMAVLALAMLRGRTLAVLYALVGGLIIDVSAGRLGESMAPMIAMGFVTGLLVYESDPRRLRELTRKRIFTRRLVCALSLSFVVEAVVVFYQYFNTARLTWDIVLMALLRVAITGFGAMLLLPAIARLTLGGGKRRAKRAGEPAREVKRF